MSHITSGRNNPSLDVLKKILEQFPHISPDWLLFGTGTMNRTSDTMVEPISQQENSRDLFADVSNIRTEKNENPEYRTETNASKPVDNIEKPVKEDIVRQKTEVREVKRIMVFYSDKTFESFEPEKNKG